MKVNRGILLCILFIMEVTVYSNSVAMSKKHTNGSRSTVYNLPSFVLLVNQIYSQSSLIKGT